MVQGVPLCTLVIMNCKIVQFPHETIHFKDDVLRTKTSTYSFLRYKKNQRYNQNKFSFRTIQNNKKGPVSGFVEGMRLSTLESRI